MVGKIKEAFHVAFPLEHIFQYPVLCDMSAQVDQLCNAEGKIEDFKLTLIKDEENLYEPFPLTDVQQAYWIGRGEAFNYSDVTTHCYFEMDCEGFDLNRAEQVWNGMIAAHGMLRAVILKDGEHQQILEKVAHYQIKTYDAISDRTILDELREEMCQEQIDIYTGRCSILEQPGWKEGKVACLSALIILCWTALACFICSGNGKIWYPMRAKRRFRNRYLSGIM